MTTSNRSSYTAGLFLAVSLLPYGGAARAQETPQQTAPDKPPARTFAYACDGVKLRVSYGDATARVRYHGHVYSMKQVLSADGGRYSDGKLVWWSKGDGGFLAVADDSNPAGGKQLAANCHVIKAPPPAKNGPENK